MGLFGNTYADHSLHLVVSLYIGTSFLVALINHASDMLIAGISSIGFSLAIIQGVYHIGRVLQKACNSKSDIPELAVGATARNLITTGLLSSLVVLLGIFGHTKDDGAAERWLNITSVAAAGVMRVLDGLLDVSHDQEGAVNDTKKRWEEIVKVQCPNPKEEPGFLPAGEGEKGNICNFFNARIVMVHLLLVTCTVLSYIIIVGENQLKLGPVFDSFDGFNMLVGVILVTVHTVLYPFAAIAKLTGVENGCIKCLGGNPEKCPDQTLEPINRIPLVRLIVAGLILCNFSYVVGSNIGKENIQIALVNLALYIGVDAIGRNVV